MVWGICWKGAPGSFSMSYMWFGVMATQKVVIPHFVTYYLRFNKNEVFGRPDSWMLNIYKSTSQFLKLFNNNS